MPGNLLTADTNFPDLEGKRSTEEKLKAVSGYLYMLLEQLRYTLANLGQDNFNDTELHNIGRLITGPLTVRVEETEKGMAQVSVTVEGITSRVEKVEGDITEGFSEVKQTASEISSKVVNNEKEISKVSQRADALEAQFQSGGKVTEIEQSVNGLGITQITENNSTFSALSSVALYFYEHQGNTKYLVGKVCMDDRGDTANGNSKYRMFIGTGYNDSANYALKLESCGDTSYESQNGSIYLKTGYSGTVELKPGSGSGGVKITAPNGTHYFFKNDGIYFGTKKIVSV